MTKSQQLATLASLSLIMVASNATGMQSQNEIPEASTFRTTQVTI